MTPAGDVNAGAETNNAQVKQRRISEEGIQEYLFIPRTAQSVGTDNLPLHGKEPIACPSVPAGVSSSAGVRPNNGDASLHHVELPQQLPSLSRYIYPQLHCSPAELNWISSDSATDDLGCYPINHIHRPFAWARACIIAALSLAGVVATLCVIGSANSESPLSAAIVVIFVLHQVTLTAFGVLLAEVTNESTVSGMVAQRYDKISYLTILVLVSYSWWTASYILCGGSARASAGGISGTSAEAVRVFVAAASPIVMLGVFLFPIVVVKNARELSMIPLDSLACVTLPPEGTARAPRASDFQQHSHFRVAFWHGMSRRWHSFMVRIRWWVLPMISRHRVTTSAASCGAIYTRFDTPAHPDPIVVSYAAFFLLWYGCFCWSCNCCLALARLLA